MPNLRNIGFFIAGYCVSECIEKDYIDYTLKPLICTVAYGVGTYYGAKITYESAALTYETLIKPAMKSCARFAKKRGFVQGNLPLP